MATAAGFAVSSSAGFQTYLVQPRVISMLITMVCVDLKQAKLDYSAKHFISKTLLLNSNYTSWQNSLEIFHSVIFPQELDCNSRWSKSSSNGECINKCLTQPSPELSSNVFVNYLKDFYILDTEPNNRSLIFTLKVLLEEKRHNILMLGKSSWAWSPI